MARSARQAAWNIIQEKDDKYDYWQILWLIDHGKGTATQTLLEEEYADVDWMSRFDEVITIVRQIARDKQPNLMDALLRR
jgi:hypothetical protein